jgi:hypothetical protein
MPDQPGDEGLTQTDYVKAALKWQYNWIGMAGAAAFALVSGSGLPLVLAAGVELMYLALVPQNFRFRRLVRSWKYEEDREQHRKKLEGMQRALPVEMRSRQAYMEQVAEQIRNNYAQLSYPSQVFATQMDEKLNGLLESYVQLLYAAHTHRDYVQSLNPEQVKTEIAYLEKNLEKDSPKVQPINRRRIEILQKRLEKFGKIVENRRVIDAQCAAIEDVLQLIRDQSVTMRDPQEVSAQLDHLVADVEQTESSIHEMEEIFAMAVPEVEGPPPEAEPQRNRVRN